MKTQQTRSVLNECHDLDQASVARRKTSKLSMEGVPDVSETSCSPEDDEDAEFVMPRQEETFRVDDKTRRVILQHMALKAAANASKTIGETSTAMAAPAKQSLVVQAGIVFSNVVVALVLLGTLLRVVDFIFTMETFDSLGVPAGSLQVGMVIVGFLAMGAVYVSETTVETKRKYL